MSCGKFWELLLKLLNFLLMLVGLAMVGYGIYLLIEWKRVSTLEPFAGGSGSHEYDFALGFERRGMRPIASISTSMQDRMRKAWFIYLFIIIGAYLLFVSLFGCIGAMTTNGCCLNFYSSLMLILIIAELACAAFIYFDRGWKQAIPIDRTGDFDAIYNFLKNNWKIAKWVALVAVIMEALAFFLALIVKVTNKPTGYESGDECIAPSSSICQPLINRQAPAAEEPGAGSLDQHQSRDDSWSRRLREKYGIDKSRFTYNNRVKLVPTSNRTQPEEKRN